MPRGVAKKKIFLKIYLSQKHLLVELSFTWEPTKREVSGFPKQLL